VLTGDDESKIPCKLRLLYQAESLGRIAHSLHIVKSPLQNGFALKRLEGIVVHQ
jgi:hypothetical protein